MSQAAQPTPGGLSVRAMHADTFAGWQEQAIADYANGKVSAGNWPAEEALARSQAEHQRLLPLGLDTPAHHLFELVTPEGDVAGMFWLNLRPAGEAAESPMVAWLFDFELFAGWRGKGLGRAALECAVDEARRLGATRLDLHVFGHNQVARHLYEAAGFGITNLNMSRSLV